MSPVVLTANAKRILDDANLGMAGVHLAAALHAPPSGLDTRGLSLIPARDATSLGRLAKGIVRRLNDEPDATTEEEADAMPKAHGALSAVSELTVNLRRVQCVAAEELRRQEGAWRLGAAEAPSSALGGRLTTRRLTPEEVRTMKLAYEQSEAGGNRTVSEYFQPSASVLSVFRFSFSQGAADGENTAAEWPSLTELPLSKVTAVKGPYSTAGEPGSLSQIQARFGLYLDAAEWASNGLSAPSGYKVAEGDETRSIFSHAARQDMQEQVTILAAAAEALPAATGVAIVNAALKRANEELRSAMLAGRTATAEMPSIVAMFRQQMVMVDREVAMMSAAVQTAPSAAPVPAAPSAAGGSPLDFLLDPARAARTAVNRERRAENKKRKAEARAAGAAPATSAPLVAELMRVLSGQGRSSQARPQKTAPSSAGPPALGQADALKALLKTIQGEEGSAAGSERAKARSTSGIPCRDFARGNYRYGEACRFSHEQ